ncbi:BAL_1a_G0025170.mRNA.1.CDS.1 [Saccharomyces cerevisiae]|nr:BAL_1a_G0025170.mRNA.1.CDS.1 [Saccharomyces cerevisiae]CAI7160650.1 BAL_1a_G0025170.mRNA.1.CDS.1 [Saccharomyces cerevisiae]
MGSIDAMQRLVPKVMHLPPVTFPNQTVFWLHRVFLELLLTKDPLRNLFHICTMAYNIPVKTLAVGR